MFMEQCGVVRSFELKALTGAHHAYPRSSITFRANATPRIHEVTCFHCFSKPVMRWRTVHKSSESILSAFNISPKSSENPEARELGTPGIQSVTTLVASCNKLTDGRVLGGETSG